MLNALFLRNPVAATPTDPYWPYVSLLANTTSSNGAQNNTFLDSSTNNFTITRNGNTTQGSFTPYGSNWSNYFGATGQYLSVPYSSAFNLTGDFTVECWINPGNLPSTTGNAAQSYERVFSFGTYNAANSIGLEINSNDSGNVRKFICWYNGASYGLSSNNAVAPGNWYHIALVRSGTVITLYINGTSTGLTITGASAAVNTSQALYIASLQGFEGDASAAYNGYISNLRVVKGTAVYTANFTPPTAPLTAISGTSLLTCQSNRFIDNSSNNFTITKNGDTKVTPFSPFSPTSAYSTTANGGSAYFDGSGDCLNISSSSAFGFGTGDFTIEFWMYYTGGNGYVCFTNTYDGGGSDTYIYYGLNTGTKRPWIWSDRDVLTTSTDITNNVWQHHAVVRSGSTIKIYLDGVVIGSTTWTADLGLSRPLVMMAAQTSGSQAAAGFMSNLRIVKSAVYTSTFTPPTAPVTAITNTSLLLNATNAGIYDSAVQNDMETVGNAQVSTTQAKFGTTSMYFDGSGDSNRIAVNQPALQFGTGNFTAEGWIYSTGGTGTYQHVLTGGTSWTSGSGGIYWYYNGGSPTLGAAWNQLPANPAVNSGTLSINTWYHFALVRNGNTLTLYINGTSVSTYSVTGYSLAFNNQNRTNIGGGGWDNDFAGYVDELRVTAGVARYTANFTPPTAAFPVQ